mmetsp:Transcript_44316/g.94323  ORF Transcript_44316/g.94323 Transcript_44316/m.94323 type:complete len:90 (-) Transcript_44316:189-458(-)
MGFGVGAGKGAEKGFWVGFAVGFGVSPGVGGDVAGGDTKMSLLHPYEAGGSEPSSQTCPLIQSYWDDILAYTPGNSGWAHPIPQLTTPT